MAKTQNVTCTMISSSACSVVQIRQPWTRHNWCTCVVAHSNHDEQCQRVGQHQLVLVNPAGAGTTPSTHLMARTRPPVLLAKCMMGKSFESIFRPYHVACGDFLVVFLYTARMLWCKADFVFVGTGRMRGHRPFILQNTTLIRALISVNGSDRPLVHNATFEKLV